MPQIALYYPWMHFQNDHWLKLALLTWDGIVRVRPPGAPDRDQDLVRQLRRESDFIVETTPGPRVLDTVATSFEQVIDTDPDRILNGYRLGYDGAWRGYEPPPSQRAPEPEPGDSELVWVFAEAPGAKMASRLAAMLVRAGLARRSAGPWLGLRPPLGSVYLAVLTDAMARHERLRPATDDPRMHTAVGALDRLSELLTGDPAPRSTLDSAESAYLHVALRSVLVPDDLDRVPTRKLIRFRERHRAELAAFHDHVASLGPQLADIAEVESLPVASAHLKALYERETGPRLDELRRALRGFGIESSAGALAQKIDLGAAGGTVLGGLAAAGGQLAVAGAAVAVSVVPYLAGRVRSRRATIRDSPVSYLLAVGRELSASTLLGKLR